MRRMTPLVGLRFGLLSRPLAMAARVAEEASVERETALGGG